MNNSESTRLPFSVFDHLTVVVKDIESAIEFYTSVGIGPFLPIEGGFSRGQKIQRILHGKQLDMMKIIVRETHIGPVVLQLVQPVEGESIYQEYLDKHGEGVQHLGFMVEDINKEEEKIVGKGIQIIERGRREDGSGYTYFDTEEASGVTLEIRSGYLERKE